jgi:nickel transport protein
MPHFHSHLPALIFILSLSWLSPAEAHKIKLFATVQSNIITGYAYYPGGGKISNTTIQVSSPEGRPLGETTTNDQGEFTYIATYRIAHTFTLNTSDGHFATYTISAEELSDTLPLLNSNNTDKTTPTEQTSPPSSAFLKPPAIPVTTSISLPELELLLEKTLNRHIRPLREQLENYQEQIRLHDILGGIGYIFGIMGLIFYWKKRT